MYRILHIAFAAMLAMVFIQPIAQGQTGLATPEITRQLQNARGKKVILKKTLSKRTRAGARIVKIDIKKGRAKGFIYYHGGRRRYVGIAKLEVLRVNGKNLLSSSNTKLLL